MERLAAQVGGGNLVAPVQTTADFLEGRLGSHGALPESSYRLGVRLRLPSPPTPNCRLTTTLLSLLFSAAAASATALSKSRVRSSHPPPAPCGYVGALGAPGEGCPGRPNLPGSRERRAQKGARAFRPINARARSPTAQSAAAPETRACGLPERVGGKCACVPNPPLSLSSLAALQVRVRFGAAPRHREPQQRPAQNRPRSGAHSSGTCQRRGTDRPGGVVASADDCVVFACSDALCAGEMC